MRQLRAVFSKAMDRSMKSFKALGHVEQSFQYGRIRRGPRSEICEIYLYHEGEYGGMFFSFFSQTQYINTYIQREFDLILVRYKGLRAAQRFWTTWLINY